MGISGLSLTEGDSIVNGQLLRGGGAEGIRKSCQQDSDEIIRLPWCACGRASFKHIREASGREYAPSRSAAQRKRRPNQRTPPTISNLLSQTETTNQLVVASDVAALYIIEHAAAL